MVDIFPGRDSIIEVAGEIRECRIRLAELESRLDELLKPSRRVTRRSTSVRRDSYAKTIHEIMSRAGDQHVFHEDELIREASISDDKKASFRSALSRLVKSQSIIKTEPKRYKSVGSAESLNTGTSESQGTG